MPAETLEQWLSDLAARQPTPGGGAAAALFAATAAALTGMVASYTTGPKWQDRSDRMEQIARKAEAVRAQASDTMADDARAFADVGKAYGLPQDTRGHKTERQQAIQAALKAAAGPPAVTARLAGELLPLLEELAAQGNPNVISDVAVGASAARAALEAAIINIEINRHSIVDATVKDDLQQIIEQAASDMRLAEGIVQTVRKGLQG